MFSWHGIFSILLQIAAIHGQRSPTIAYVSQEQIKGIGESVELKCSVSYQDNYSVLWEKRDSTGGWRPLSAGTTMVIGDSRFSIDEVTEEETTSYILKLSDIQQADSGSYFCKVYISVTEISSAEVKLTVRHPPFIFDNSTLSVVASEGEPVELFCYAGGFPKPTITWRRANNEMLAIGRSLFTGDSLKIPSVSRTDRGTYFCVADNQVGMGARRRISIELQFRPVIKVNHPRLGQALQYDKDLECNVEAYPSPAITWLKDGLPLVTNQHYGISHFSTADEYTDTTLRVITIEKKQYGEYVCRAENAFGSAEGTVELFETIVPVCPPACDIPYYGSGGVEVTSGLVLISLLVVSTIISNFSSES